jgi:hypothetical protein
MHFFLFDFFSFDFFDFIIYIFDYMYVYCHPATATVCCCHLKPGDVPHEDIAMERREWDMPETRLVPREVEVPYTRMVGWQWLGGSGCYQCALALLWL